MICRADYGKCCHLDSIRKESEVALGHVRFLATHDQSARSSQLGGFAEEY